MYTNRNKTFKNKKNTLWLCYNFIKQIEIKVNQTIRQNKKQIVQTVLEFSVSVEIDIIFVEFSKAIARKVIKSTY